MWWDSECRAPLPESKALLVALTEAACAVSAAHKMAGIYAPRFIVPERALHSGELILKCVLGDKVIPLEGAARRVPLWG